MSSKNSKTSVFKSLCLQLLLSAIVLSNIAHADESMEEASKRAALAVEVQEVVQGDIRELVYADGNSRAVRREFLLFESSARISFLKTNEDGGPLREGDSVTKGELLAELDRRIDDASVRVARAELDTSRATLSNAKTEYERAKRLKAANAIPQSRFEATETAYQQALASVRGAEAAADQARAGLRQLQIRAPFDGQIAFVNIREGQFVSPEQFDPASDQSAVRTAPIVVIDPKSFEIILELPVSDGRRVRPGQPAYILDEGALAIVQQNGFDAIEGVSSIDDMLIPARVGSVSPAVDSGSRSIRARVVTDEVVEGLVDGGYVTVWVEIGRQSDAVIVPQESLIYRGETAIAYALDTETNMVERRELKLGIIGSDGAEVLSGLKPGEIVITKGRFRLTDGMAVRRTDLNGG